MGNAKNWIVVKMDLNKIYCGDSWELAKQISDESIDMVITSPPYWGLRDYGTAQWVGGSPDCKHIKEYNTDKKVKDRNTDIQKDFCRYCGGKRVDRQAGLEEHPQQWVDKMVGLCELLRPKIKKTGSLWFNIGETYFSGNSQWQGKRHEDIVGDGVFNRRDSINPSGKFKPKNDGAWLQSKQLLGLPWRFAIAMQNGGWILRNAIIWQKNNAMPSSVKDRFSPHYEYLFFFVKQGRYHFDLDSVRIPHKYPADVIRQGASFNIRVRDAKMGIIAQKWGELAKASEDEIVNYDKKCYQTTEKWNLMKGKNPGDVWTINTKPHPWAHYAVFPEEIVERPIKAGCPKDGVVLDPFMGSGTTAVVAKRLQRKFIGFELNPKYIEIAHYRLEGVSDWKIVEDIKEGRQKRLI